MVSNGELILTDQQWLICMNQNFHLWWHSNDFINLLFSYVSICYSFVKQRSLLPTEAVWFQKHNFFQIDRIIANLSPFKLLIVKSWFGLTVSSNSDQHIFFFFCLSLWAFLENHGFSFHSNKQYSFWCSNCHIFGQLELQKAGFYTIR